MERIIILGWTEKEELSDENSLSIKRTIILNKMRQFAVILLMLSACVLQAGAQSFLNELKSKKTGEGTVTVTQSADIDELVNNTKLVKSSPATPERHPDADKNTEKGGTENHPEHAVGTHPEHAAGGNTTADAPSVNTGKKVMLNSRKVTGYRIQVFSGGNSREDRQKAESIGSAIKMRYAGLPVYVHFYSPRWICRVGNFRTYQEAESVLKEIKGMGYRQACIVKGKITVAY